MLGVGVRVMGLGLGSVISRTSQDLNSGLRFAPTNMKPEI